MIRSFFRGTFFIRKLTDQVYLTYIAENNTSFKMSTVVSSDVSKRKLESNEQDEIEAKKCKLASEESVDGLMEKLTEESNRERKPKKVVLLLSYLGKNYFGMQRNHNVNTVELELFKALLEAKVILKDEFDYPKKIKFQRAARTDKGVSAIKNIVSLKIPLRDIGDSLAEKVNGVLPPEIRLVGVKRVTQSFDAKIACDARTYAYMLPTFAFSNCFDGEVEAYRITSEKIDEVNEFLKKYLGTHNFYNFTSGRLPGDPSCKRYIMECQCGPPFESHGLEFCVIKVKGQSFMLHQIRKMVGLAIAHTRQLTNEAIMDKAWHNERIDIPKAPGLGLMLEDLHYDWYDSKYGSDGVHEPLKWDKYQDTIEKFKMEKICANIAQAEREEKSMLQWLETLPHHSYDVRDAGPPTKLPAKTDSEAIIKDSDNLTSSVNNGESADMTSSVDNRESTDMTSPVNNGESTDVTASVTDSTSPVKKQEMPAVSETTKEDIFTHSEKEQS